MRASSVVGVAVPIRGVPALAGPTSLLDVSSAAVQALEVPAVLGVSLSAEGIAGALAETVVRLMRRLGELLDAEVIVPADDFRTFEDEGLRRRLNARFPNGVRLALHRQIALLMLDHPWPVDTAAHLSEAIGPNDRDGLEAAGAVHAAPPGAAPVPAVRVLEPTETSEGLRVDRGVVAMEELIAIGRLGEATELAQRMLTSTPPDCPSAAQVRLKLLSILIVAGRPAQAVEEAETLLAEAGHADDVYVAAEAGQLLGTVIVGDFQQARAIAESVLAGDGPPRRDGCLPAALASLAYIAWQEGRALDALGLLRAAVKRSTLGPPESRGTHPAVGVAAILTALGEFGEAGEAIIASRARIQAMGDDLWASAPPVLHSSLHLAEGRLEDAAAAAHAALEMATQSGAQFFVPMADAVLATIGVLRGDLREAARHAQGYHSQLPGNRGWFGAGTYAWIDARLVEAREGDGRGVDILTAVFADLSGHRGLFLDQPGAAAWLTRTALAAGRRAEADAVVRWAEQLAAFNPGVTSLAASAAHCQGLFEREVPALDQAAEGYRHPWCRASAYEDAAKLLAAAGHEPAAGARLDSATSFYEIAGAVRDAARSRARLRRARDARRRGERPLSGWASLTATERRVADVIAEGVTNAVAAERMFLSRHTVDFHLRQIFRKLGIGSRVELTRLLLEHEQQGGGPSRTQRSPASRSTRS